MPGISNQIPDPCAQAAQPRQWFAFPDSPITAKMTRLASFRVLVEDELGHLSFVETRGRAPPEQALMLAALAADGWVARRPWQQQRTPDGPMLHMDADIEDFTSWPLEPAVRDALGAALAVHGPAQASAAGALRDDLRAQLTAQLANGIESFVARLDAEIVRMAHGAGALTPARYNYLAGRDTLTRRNRLQATGRHPILLDRLATAAEYEPIRQTIDQGGPLLDRLAFHFGVPRAVIRRVADTPLDWISTRWRALPHALMRLLSDIDPSKRPASREQWAQFDHVVALVTQASGHPPTTMSNRLWIRRSTNDGFRQTPPEADLAGVAAVLEAFSSSLLEAVKEDLRGVTDPSQADHLALNALARVQASLGVERMSRLAAKWLTAWRAEQAAAEAEIQLARGERWPSLLPPEGLELEGLRVVALCTPGSLRDEAARMENCVDTYVTACKRGECQIFSIRSGDDAPRSTIETKLARTLGGFSLVTIQHVGVRNSPPPAECKRAASALLRRLSRSKAELEAYWRWRTNVVRLTRTDQVTAARMAASRRALERVLPKRIGYGVLLEDAMGPSGDRRATQTL